MTTDEALSSIRKTLDSSLQANPEAWNVVHDELQRLQSELAQAQACCAEMRPFINGLFKVMCGEATLHGYDWPQIDKVLSSTCGTALLEELKELREMKFRAKGRLTRMLEIKNRWHELGETECESIYRSAVLELELLLNEKETQKTGRV